MELNYQACAPFSQKQILTVSTVAARKRYLTAVKKIFFLSYHE